MQTCWGQVFEYNKSNSKANEMPWFGLLAPAKTPMVVVDRLLTDTCATLKSAEMRQALVRQGAEPGGLSSAAFVSYYSSEIRKWAGVVKFAGVRLEQ